MNTIVQTRALLLLFLIPGWLRYTDQANRFTVDYPKEWTTNSANGVIAFLSPQAGANDNFRENVNVLRQDLSAQPMTLEQYTELSRRQITENFGANAILSQGTKIISGQKAVAMVYNMTYQGRNLKIGGYWFIKDKTAWVLTYTAEPAQFGKYEETATSIINSFTFF